jgi:hypothetical protein
MLHRALAHRMERPLGELINALQTEPARREDFIKDIRRFLPAATVRDTIEQEQYWTYLTGVLEDLTRKATATLE